MFIQELAQLTGVTAKAISTFEKAKDHEEAYRHVLTRSAPHLAGAASCLRARSFQNSFQNVPATAAPKAKAH